MGMRKSIINKYAKSMGIDRHNPLKAIKRAVSMACTPAVRSGVISKKELQTMFNEIVREL